MFSRFGLTKKLFAGFFFVVLMLGATIGFLIMELHSLSIMQDVGAKRGEDFRSFAQIMETLDMAYAPMADGVIVRQVDKTKSSMAALESQAGKDATLIMTLVDTEQEKGWANEYIANFKAFLGIAKDEVLPLLQAKAGDKGWDEETEQNVRKMFERLDEKRGLADAALAKLEASLAKESEEADRLYAIQKPRIMMIATSAALLSGLIAMLIGFFLTRSIARPVNDAVQDLTSGVDRITASSGQVSSASQNLAEGSSRQAASMEETSASLEELTSMTKQNADNANQADGLMRQSLSTISSTNMAMEEMGHSMSEIATSSEQTFKIIKTIDEIAFQTNLLALNAAVEAARAGEAGAGFAVVADEVRNLAMRATEAAKNTAQLIEDTVEKVNAGKSIVDRVTGAFQEVAASSAKVGGLLGEITAASKEQAQGIVQINQAIAEMDSVTQQNAATSEQSAAAAEELNSQAASLIGTVSVLRTLVDGAPAKSGQAQPAPAIQGKAAVASVTRRPAVAKGGRTARPAVTPALSAPVPPLQRPVVAKAAPVKKTQAVDPESVIPMGDDDTFEDF